MKESLVISC